MEDEVSRRRKGFLMLAVAGATLVVSLTLLLGQLGVVSLAGLSSWTTAVGSGSWLPRDWAFWNSGSGEPVIVGYQRIDVNLPTPAPAPQRIGLTPPEMAELRRVQQEHLKLIASIPPTATPVPLPAEVRSGAPDPARQSAARARVQRQREGVPYAPAPGEDWFNPERGLEFYRERGGDWTGKDSRELHPYAGLFYYEFYPETTPNFADGSIFKPLSRELAFELVALLPPLVEVTPALIDALARNMGWELREGREPVVNLWSSFSFNEEGRPRRYAVGGVMRMAVRSWEEQGRVWEYVVPGEWIGPVALERLH